MSQRLRQQSTGSFIPALGALTAVLALGTAPAIAQIPQPEICISQFAGVISPGQHVCGAGGTGLAQLTPVGHIDIFAFSYVAGETLWFDGYTAGSLDIQLRVLDPASGFALVASTWCPGNEGGWPFGPVACGAAIALTPALGLATGGYLIEVSDYGSDETGSYSLSLGRITPPAGPVLANATIVTDTISPVTDIDLLGFDAVQGSLVNVYLRTMGCLDLEYRVIDATGIVVTAPNYIPGNEGGWPFGCIVNQVSFNPFAVPGNPNAPVPTTGTYWLVLRDSGLTETGTYNAQVQCLYSPTGCPSTPAPFNLAITQPTGSRSLAINVSGGLPNAPYITAFSFDPVNAPAPHTGWFGGLHIGFPELAFEIGLGWPFIGTLDGNGASSFASVFPPGPFPTLYAVTVRLSPSLQSFVTATPVVTANLL